MHVGLDSGEEDGRMIHFVIQNETHALNFEILADELVKLGVPKERVKATSFDRVFHLSTQSDGLPNHKPSGLCLDVSFYRLASIDRLRWLSSVQDDLRTLVEGDNVIVFGSDGAIQRCMANAVRRAGGDAVLLFDGLLHPWPDDLVTQVKMGLRRDLLRVASTLGLGHLVPGVTGHGPIDYMFVMHSTVKDILREQGRRGPIEVIKLPRMQAYQEEIKRIRGEVPPVNQLLYVTGAFKWHSLKEEHENQKQDLEDLAQFAIDHPEWTVRIRIHPREKEEEYRNRSWPVNVELSTGRTPVVHDLAWSSVVVTAFSTMAVEADLVGIPVMIYRRNFRQPSKSSIFSRHPNFRVITNLEAVTEIASRRIEPESRQDSTRHIANMLAQLDRGGTHRQ